MPKSKPAPMKTTRMWAIVNAKGRIELQYGQPLVFGTKHTAWCEKLEDEHLVRVEIREVTR